MSEAQPGAGDIEIVIDGEKVTLKPGLEACMALTTDPNGIFGGDNSIYGRINRFDLAVMARVVRLGLGLGASAVKDLEERMFKTGLMTLKEPLHEYLVVIVNGGQRVQEPAPDAKVPPEKAAG